MIKPCKSCRHTKHKPIPVPVQQTEQIKIELPDQKSGELRRTLVGTTLRIRLKRPD